MTFAPATRDEVRVLRESGAASPARLRSQDHTGRGPVIDTPYDEVHRIVGSVAARIEFRYTDSGCCTPIPIPLPTPRDVYRFD